MSNADEAETLATVNALAASLVTSDEPYWIAKSVGDAASDALVSSLIACDVYHLWRGLTDWYELKPSDRPAAVAAMRQAASDWAVVNDEPAARAAYFERWSDDLGRLQLLPGWGSPPTEE